MGLAWFLRVPPSCTSSLPLRLPPLSCRAFQNLDIVPPVSSVLIKILILTDIHLTPTLNAEKVEGRLNFRSRYILPVRERSWGLLVPFRLSKNDDEAVVFAVWEGWI